MFAIGDYIVYGIHGVCEVTDVCDAPFNKSDGRTFYALRPYHENNASVIYTPVDNETVVMRALMTRDEIAQLLTRIPAIEEITVPTEKARKDTYRAVFSTQSPDDYVRIIKTVRGRREALTLLHKRMPDADLDYEARAKRCLFTEFSLVLGIPMTEVDDYIHSNLCEA